MNTSISSDSGSTGGTSGQDSGGALTLIRSGIVFDGTGGPRRNVDILVSGNTITEIGPDLPSPEGATVIDATGHWVTPGFIDLHTHYDAELEVSPGLDESVRHGVTTVLIGSCGLSLLVGEPEDLADTFCRVEGIPHPVVLEMLRERKDWNTPAEYVDHLNSLALGPNVIAMAGHSAIRTYAMGIDRALDSRVTPSESEMNTMVRLVSESLDAGLAGLSVNLLPWDKMGGTRYRSLPTPSVFAKFSEYRRLSERCRTEDRVFQAIPNLQTRWTIGPLLDMSRPRNGNALRTSLLTMMDAPPALGAYRAMAVATNFYNSRLGAHVRFQALPNPFDLYTDGIENPVFEELGAGTEALHIEDVSARQMMFSSPGFRARFAAQWNNKIASRAYHRNLAEARVVTCPNESLNGMTFAEIGARDGVSGIDAFMDLQAQYGNDLRWYSVVANQKESAIEWIVSNPASMIGFSDAGAHLRNMGFYNFPLRMLKRVRDAERQGRAFMTLEEAVYKLTADIADFHRVDAGRIQLGARADLVVLDPQRLDESVEEIHEAEMPKFGGLKRLVRRNDATVTAVLVNGNLVWTPQGPTGGLGTERGNGRVLAAG